MAKMTKVLALVAHDNMKRDLAEWVDWNSRNLSRHHLVCTGTSGKMVEKTLRDHREEDESADGIRELSDLKITLLKSGPLGGDQQIGAKVVEGQVDFIIFFSDPLTAQPHDPDVKALLRIAQVYDIPIANNKATADFMITSPLMDEEYEHDIINFHQNIKERAKTL